MYYKIEQTKNIIAAGIIALALTALMLCCIWVASDADDYDENRRKEDEE